MAIIMVDFMPLFLLTTGTPSRYINLAFTLFDECFDECSKYFVSWYNISAF